MLKYSFIMPVYNIDSYLLRRSINSVLSQQFDSWELLIIDDGSNVSYGDIINDYESKNVQFFRTNNRGVSSARNHGIKEAKGEYLVFIDPDDFITNDFLSVFDNILKNNNYDLCICNFSINKIEKNHIHDSIIFNNKREIINLQKSFLANDILISQKFRVTGAPWGKIYKKSIILTNNIFFNENLPRSQDIEFNFRYASCIDNVLFVNKKMYVYTINENSAMRKYWPSSYKNAILFLKILKEDIDCLDNSQEYLDSYYNIRYQKYIEVIETNYLHKLSKLSIVGKYRSIKKLQKNKNFSCQKMNTKNMKLYSKLNFFCMKKNIAVGTYILITTKRIIKQYVIK